MRKLIFIVIAAASYYIAGMYRQMPLMILALMEWILFIILFILSRCLRKNLTVSFPMQSTEAEKGSVKKCLIHIGRTGALPIKKVCIKFKVCDDEGSVVQKNKVKKTVDILTGNIDFDICLNRCGMFCIQIDKVYIYDYLSVFHAPKIVNEEMKLAVLPKARALQMQLLSTESIANQTDEAPYQPHIGYLGNETREIRQTREYRTGDTMRYIHWNQSAKTEKLWIKEFEKEDEASFEILLDMIMPDDWKRDKRDCFYEVISALILGFLQRGQSVNVSWYDGKVMGFITIPIENRLDYRSMMRKLFQTEFIKRTDVIEKAYERKQALPNGRLLKCNLLLECYEIKDSGKEELRHRFSYENLEEELSGDNTFPLR
ncbi:MAG: DUF58 domain-containing protein [Lachnospiraceae bacterium]|nr:DUF58 domain-containing protein [Lachnospiraceae bacterium]